MSNRPRRVELGDGNLDDKMQNPDDCASHATTADGTSANLTVSRVEKVETVKKLEKKDDVEDPKPRIVLTFRSEKSGAKSSNMKIVTPEEKQEEVSPRRSSRTRHSRLENFEDTELPSRRDKSLSSQPASENDETSDGSHAGRRSTPRRSREPADVLATAIARKEKSYNEAAPSTPQRLSRRIKPTAKILANEELRIGLESQNNARLGLQSDKPEEGVSTRRSRQCKSAETTALRERSAKRKGKDESKDSDNSVMKLKHLCELGLKAISKSADEESSEDNSEMEEGEEEEIDDDTEIINKLLEADEEWDGESSDDEFLLAEGAAPGGRPRRSRRLCSSYANDSDHSSPARQQEKAQSRPRRSTRFQARVAYGDGSEQSTREFENESLDHEFAPKRKRSRAFEQDDSKQGADRENSPAAGDEESEAASPGGGDTSAVVCTCFCEEPSNVHAEAAELTEPVFCQAIEMVDGVRAGCSHAARRERAGGPLAALLRAGPRAPFFLACALHAAQLARHMCCPTCGLFCTQGIFYQCSKGHLFHLECGILCWEAKQRPGCPHCGVNTHRWQPVSRDCVKVQVQMNCTNERIYLPDQRVQCTPAYLGFSALRKSQLDAAPVIPEELLPALPAAWREMCGAGGAGGESGEGGAREEAERLYDAIVDGETVDQLLPKIVRGPAVNAALASRGGDACAHAAAARGHLGALYLLHFAGAALDAADASGRTPLVRAVLALVDKHGPEEMEVELNESPQDADGKDAAKDESHDGDVKMEVDGLKMEAEEEKEDGKPEEGDKEGADRPSDEDLMRVIRYLIAAGCDLDLPGPEGLTALHVAAAAGGGAGAGACAALLGGGAAADARDAGGWTPLVRACENAHADVVRLLLEAGADACAADAEGNGAAHWCALAGAAAALRALLAAAPHAAHQANQHKDTPLHIAAREGHYSCVVILLARGARTDVANAAGQLPGEACAPPCQAAIALHRKLALAAPARACRLLHSDISRGREPWPVECVNEVDEEGAPQFTYVSRHALPAPLALDHSTQAMQGCACEDGACATDACGCGALGVRRWYRAGRLPPAFPYHDPPMLFECNQTCGCDLKRCTNHVVSRIESLGSIGVRVTVFRTARRGWGLRARERVPRGAPVALYCGELLPRALADARENDHYMFALDVKPDLLDQCYEKTQLCVDAAQLGSCARFINHSCRPNLAPVRVFTAARDLRLPAVALFALRDLCAGEELTFDYGDKFWAVKSKWMKCECESPDCRYPTMSTEENVS